MNPDLYKEIAVSCTALPIPIPRLHAAAQDRGSSWSSDQVHLLFSCLEDWTVSKVGNEWTVERAGLSETEALEQAIITVVQSQGGKPMPASAIMPLLPSKFTTSEAQIRKLAKESGRLGVSGPGLVILAK
jgi:hypothetical protein